jgi:para-aminobenzoate synthetase / 4-amino-4-deoxychorismate lyase
MDHHPDRRLGIFTSMAVRSGRPVDLARHLQRLGNSCREVYGTDLPGSVEPGARAAAHGGPGSHGEHQIGRLRIDAVPQGAEGADLDIRFTTGPPITSDAGTALEVVVARLWEGGHKWTDRSALPSAHSLVVDQDGSVLETTIANVFIVVDGTITTPPLDGRILPGTTRSHIIEMRDVREEPVMLADLLAADEVFVSNALRGVVPVLRCGDHTWTAPGSVAEALAPELSSLG